MSGRNKGKAKIHMSKPDLPPFLQRIKEQIVANESSERREQSEKKRKQRPGRSADSDDDPTVVKIGDDDLTEEEYKRMKMELETQYKLDSDKTGVKQEELDVDLLIKTRCDNEDLNQTKDDKFGRSNKPSAKAHTNTKVTTPIKLDKKEKQINEKKLSYGSSSDDED